MMEKISYCGIDCSSKNVAIVSMNCDEKLLDWFFLVSKSKDVQERIFDLHDSFVKIVMNGFRPYKIAIEDSIFVQNYKTSKVLNEMIGDLKIACKMQAIPFEVVSNTTWKKQIIGNGRASKADIKNFIVRKYHVLKEEPQDICDACAIALWITRRDKNG